jgi:hypothetical protein
MPLNGKFIEKYGKAWLAMDDGERQMSLMSEMFDLREEVAPLVKTCKVVDRHSIYFTALWIILTAILIPVLLLAIKSWFNL